MRSFVRVYFFAPIDLAFADQEPCRQWIQYFGFMQRAEEIEVRPFSSREEYERMLDYFYKADDQFLGGMGVDRLIMILTERDTLREVIPFPIVRELR